MYRYSFADLQLISRSMGENKDCTVKAIAVVCDVDYEMAHYAMEQAGRKPRQGAYRAEQKKAVESLMFTWTDVTKDFWRTDARTVVTIERVLRREAVGRRFLIYTAGHVAAFDGRDIVDWTKGRRHRVQQIIEVTPNA